MFLKRLLSFILPLALFAGQCTADAVDDLASRGRAALNAQLVKSTPCTPETLQVRREWGDLSRKDRRSYIAAVLCLSSKPSKLDSAKYPGAKTRYDDFVAVHINQTLSVHMTGSFLSWHRYFTWSYEQALRTECGYKGTQPYWDWGIWADSPETSPIFDGSDSSMSGNGEKIMHNNNGYAPIGNGGGCVMSGPFKNFTINLGPVAATDPEPPWNPQPDGMGYNPRCLRRDISNYLTSRYAKTSDIVNLITNYNDIAGFQRKMQAEDGVHGAGHFTAGADFYSSPGDPVFWLLHSMIDRVWYIWQVQDLENRLQVIAGGTQMEGGGRAQTLEDFIDLDVVNVDGKVWKIKELVSTVDGPFCYTYE